jgi:hypothetical protein
MKVTCRPVAPTARSMANSLVRCATMILNVFWMMKAPTNTATPAMTSRIVLRKPIPSLTSTSSSSVCCSAVTISTCSGSCSEINACNSPLSTPDAAVSEMDETIPSMSKTRCASPNSNTVNVAPRRLSASPKVAIPTISNGSTPTDVITSMTSPTARLFASAAKVSMAICPGWVGQLSPSRMSSGESASPSGR